jgi:uncharacterized protein (DUF362 family)
MSSEKNNNRLSQFRLSRRKLIGAGVFALAVGPTAVESLAGNGSRNGKSRVVRITGTRLFNGTRPATEKIEQLLAAATRELVGAAGFAGLFSAGDRVAIKLNCLAGLGLSSSKEVVDAVIANLVQAGVNKNNIILFERVGRDLERAGYKLNTGVGVKCYGHDMLAQGYDSRPTVLGSLGSCFSRVLTEHCDKMINIGVLKDHDLAGISIAMKNLYGLIHNPSKYHDNSCSPYVAEVAAHPLIKKKLMLHICDGLVGQYHGGPGYKPAYSWPARTILVSRDPVALDAVGTELIEKRRKQAGLPMLAAENRYPIWLQVAGKLGLGQPDIKRIEVRDI